MERRGAVLARNLAKAKEAEFSAERQRLKYGFVTFIRKGLIQKSYDLGRRKGRP